MTDLAGIHTDDLVDAIVRFETKKNRIAWTEAQIEQMHHILNDRLGVLEKYAMIRQRKEFVQANGL